MEQDIQYPPLASASPHTCTHTPHMCITQTHCPNQKNKIPKPIPGDSKEGRAYLADSLRVQSIMIGGAWQREWRQESEAAGRSASAVRKQKQAPNAGVHFPLLFGLGPSP